MRKVIYFFGWFVVLSCFLAAQERSDYETVQKFQSMVKVLARNVDSAKTVQDCADVSASIDAMIKEFHPDSELLSKVLYPEDYTTTLENLRNKLFVRQKDLGVIETQFIRITELETKVRELSDSLAMTNAVNEKLLSDVQKLTLNVKKLTAELGTVDSLRRMIAKLQRGLQDRDALIFALTDSLFMQYDKNVSDMKDVEKQGLTGKVERRGVVSNIKRAIQDNVAFLESTQLKGNDLVAIIRQQQRFQSQWNGLGPKIAALYATGKQKKNEVAVVDSMLSTWGGKVDNAMWRSLNSLFKDKGFAVKEFKNGDEFTANLIAFIDEQIQNPNKEMMEIRSKLFANFDENVWQSDLSTNWLPALVDCGKITEAQKKDIEDKVDTWRSSVNPGASWVIYVLILGVIAIVVAAVIRLRKRKATIEPQA
jgi:hypothetical protein